MSDQKHPDVRHLRDGRILVALTRDECAVLQACVNFARPRWSVLEESLENISDTRIAAAVTSLQEKGVIE